MELDKMNQKAMDTPAFKSEIKNAAQAKDFFRLLWFELGLDFNPDDDFSGYGVFSDEVAAMLNERMDEAFDVLGAGIYDVAFNVMGEEKR